MRPGCGEGDKGEQGETHRQFDIRWNLRSLKGIQEEGTRGKGLLFCCVLVAEMKRRHGEASQARLSLRRSCLHAPSLP